MGKPPLPEDRDSKREYTAIMRGLDCNSNSWTPAMRMKDSATGKCTHQLPQGPSLGAGFVPDP